MNYAPVTNRYVGEVIDIVLVYIITLVVSIVFGGLGAVLGDLIAALLAGLGSIINLAVFLLYWPIQGVLSGQTIGDKVMKTRVVTANEGGKISLGQGLIRHVVGIVDWILFGLIGVLFIKGSDRKQRLGDKVAGTVVLPA